jgi:Domain of unknown function (DUF4440)
MRHLPTIAAAVLLLGPAAARASPADDARLASELTTMEKASWVAWQGHDGAFFDRFLSADHVEMQGAGPSAKAPVVAGVKAGCEVKSYQVDHFRMTRFGPDTALITYRAEQDTTCGTAKVPSPVWATSLFVRRDGRWQNALYVHSPAAK